MQEDQPLDLGAPTKRRASPDAAAEGQPTIKAMKPEESSRGGEQVAEPSGPSPRKVGAAGFHQKFRIATLKHAHLIQGLDFFNLKDLTLLYKIAPSQEYVLVYLVLPSDRGPRFQKFQ